MDVPAGTVNVAWYALGPHPGSVGSAVIGGHYGRYEANKGPTVFYLLDQLKGGDKVYIEDDSGNTLAFVVRRVELFDRNADASSVFNSGDGLAHLNLITCEGVWNQVNDSYPDRRVVFTDAIPSEGAVMSKPKLPQTAGATPILSPALTPILSQTLSPTPVLKENTAVASDGKKPLSTPQALVLSAKSLFATPIDGIITSFLLLMLCFVVFKLFRDKRYFF